MKEQSVMNSKLTMKIRNGIVVTLLFITSCSQTTPATINESITPSLIKIIQTIEPTETAVFPTTIPSSPTSITQRPFLILYRYHSDGGDEIYTCLQAVGQPQFILYEDGELITRQQSYIHAILSQDQVDSLMKDISDTGLFERSEKEYSDGWDELIIKDKQYISGHSMPQSDPIYKTFEILWDFKPKDASRYIPESLVLRTYRIHDIGTIEDYLSEPFSPVSNWHGSVFNEFRLGRTVIRGEDVKKIMEQFDSFPDIKILQEDDRYYAALICANFEID